MADGTAKIPNSRPYDLITESIEDLLVEARNFADGDAVNNQAQADQVSRIIDGLNKHAKALDDARIEEKKPLDEQVNAIQTRYGAWIADRKNKTPGKVWKAVDALKAALAPYLRKLDDEKREKERIAREEAEQAARAAAEAIRAADATNLEAREAAEEKVREAEDAQRAAKIAANDRAHATGGERAMGLRTKHVGTIIDLNEAVKFYWRQDDGPFRRLVQSMVDADVRAGRRGSMIPGVAITEERVL